MKAIGYVRVSTEEQCREGVSLQMQVDKVKAYCSLNDMELVEIIEDAGISAKNITGRPGFQRALDAVYGGAADALVVYKLDRAFRSTKDALAVAEKLNKQGKALHSITEKLDTTSAIGEFFFTLMASLAQMERKLIGERTKAALQSKRDRGEKLGGDVPYGFRVREGSVCLEEDKMEQKVISEARELRALGCSFRRTAQLLNDEGYRTKRGCAWTGVQVARIVDRGA